MDHQDPPVLRPGGFWNEPFGASMSYPKLVAGADAVAFLRRGKELLAH